MRNYCSLCTSSEGKANSWQVWFRSSAKSEATLDIAEPALALDGCPGCPFCCCGCCCSCICRSCCCLLIASSIRVRTFGTGGGGEVGIPNGFFDPVCCATRGLMGSGELVFSGADAGRGGTGILFIAFCGKGGGCDCCCCNCCGSENGELALGCWLGLNELARLNCICCCGSGVWPNTGNGLVPWLVGEGPNGEEFVGGGPNGGRLNPVACGCAPFAPSRVL